MLYCTASHKAAWTQSWIYQLLNINVTLYDCTVLYCSAGCLHLISQEILKPIFNSLYFVHVSYILNIIKKKHIPFYVRTLPFKSSGMERLVNVFEKKSFSPSLHLFEQLIYCSRNVLLSMLKSVEMLHIFIMWKQCSFQDSLMIRKVKKKIFLNRNILQH